MNALTLCERCRCCSVHDGVCRGNCDPLGQHDCDVCRKPVPVGQGEWDADDHLWGHAFCVANAERDPS